MRIVIAGASRGIGLELARQLLERGDVVEAGVRDAARSEGLLLLRRTYGQHLRIHTCDVADDDAVRSFAAALGDAAVDVLIHNAGISGDASSLDDVDTADLLRTFNVNAIGPVRTTRAILPMLRKARSPKIALVTSKMGSIADNGSGGYYGYRMSKAALNMAGASMAHDLRGGHVATVLLHPGWVKTDMGGAGATTSVLDSVRGMLAVIDALTLETSGRFFGFRGDGIPW